MRGHCGIPPLSTCFKIGWLCSQPHTRIYFIEVEEEATNSKVKTWLTRIIKNWRQRRRLKILRKKGGILQPIFTLLGFEGSISPTKREHAHVLVAGQGRCCSSRSLDDSLPSRLSSLELAPLLPEEKDQPLLHFKKEDSYFLVSQKVRVCKRIQSMMRTKTMASNALVELVDPNKKTAYAKIILIIVFAKVVTTAKVNRKMSLSLHIQVPQCRVKSHAKRARKFSVLSGNWSWLQARISECEDDYPSPDLEDVPHVLK
ncbi:hypothetical protein VNO77_03319 [Canavalia gladiata]|uniref:Uncharacterized protein n=1 Tax=Canavalia gladiata TaxID=3824 RepID=A0AAN9MUI6_CANGL